jgi:hypothetical protein
VRLASVLVASLLLALPAAAQPAPSGFDALKVSGDITGALARHDVDGAARMAAPLMEGKVGGKLKNVFDLVNALGQGQYTDLVYARDYGRTEKDIIYKIDFEKAFLFVRYLYHVDNGAWRLINIRMKTENEEPLPKDWVHIYPQ